MTWNMAEQISHKKSLRVGKNKRSLLKEYYHLEDGATKTDEPVTGEVHEQDNNTLQTDTGNEEVVKEVLEDSDSQPNVDRPINEQTLKELVATHNTLLGKETATNSSIKNTIYENYYDLVKGNDKLKELSGDKLQQSMDSLKKAVEESLRSA